MFRGSTKLFKIGYFITSMFPSILLFSAKNLLENTNLSDKRVFLLLSETLLFIIIAIIQIHSIKSKYKDKFYLSQNIHNMTSFNKNEINIINGDPLSFIVSNVTSVYVITNFFSYSIFGFVMILIAAYIMMINSNNIQPNVFYIICKIDIIKTKNNDFLISLNDNNTHNEILKFNENNKDLFIVGNLDDI